MLEPILRRCSPVVLSLPLLVLALAGCKDGGEQSEASDETAGETEGETGGEGIEGIDLDGCPGGTLIGILDSREDSCDLDGTVPEGWFSELLFADGPMPTPDVPGELARFCKYKRDFNSEGGYSTEEYLRMLEAIDAAPTMDVNTVALNCAVQQAQTGLAESSEVQTAAREAFRLNIGHVAADALAASAGARELVDFALLDTIPDDKDDMPEFINEHGLQMQEIAHDIVCPGGEPECLERVYPVLAMPRETNDGAPIWSTGGEYGAQTDVGIAIYAAVRNWTRDLDKPDGAPHLVLNLSLGWETANLTNLDPNRGPVEAVKAALEFAACRGALVFGAAGNNRIPECPEDHTGLLYPAAFETLSAPDEATCEALGYTLEQAPENPIFGGEWPLIVAVGGVDAFDSPLVNSRDEGQPALVALGANGIAASQSLSSASLTGTSVSTVVASSTAALIWAYRPELTPDELIALIYEAGWDTGASASAGRNAGESVHRISVCASLDAACEGLAPDLCPALDCPATAAAADGNLGTYFDTVDQTLAGATVASFSLDLPGESPECSEGLNAILAEPQPEVPVCPYCSVDLPPGGGGGGEKATLYISVDSTYIGSITDAVFVSYDAARTPTTHVLSQDIIDSLNDSSSGVTAVELDAPDTASATIEFALDDPTGPQTQTNPVTVNRT